MRQRRAGGVVLAVCAFLNGTVPAQPPQTSITSIFSEVASSVPSAVTTKGTPVPGPALREPDMDWVEDTLASLTLDQKIGQMIMPQWTSNATALNLRDNHHVGGFIFLANTSTTIENATRTLQQGAAVPLIFSIDCEAGSGARITDGTRFPYNMGIAATRDLEAARLEGRITARECRAVGVQIGFGPVLDVNTEPINPIIGPRAYSDEPELVTAMARAYLQGANEEGLLVTLKHYPGHGATEGDTHEGLQTVHHTREELDAVDLMPYRTLIGEGLGDLVMSAHVWYPELDPGVQAVPATLSHAALTEILREELGFQGVVVSDAFNMAGLTVVATQAEAARVGVMAGLDIVLMPTSTADAHAGIKTAVLGGQISQQRIDASVRRILMMKSRVGMPELTASTPEIAAATVYAPEHVEAANSIGARTIAAARVDDALPLKTTDRVLVVTCAGSGVFYNFPRTHFTDAMEVELPLAAVMNLGANPSGTQINGVIDSLGNYDRVVLAYFNWDPAMSSSRRTLLERLHTSDKPLVFCSFGSPYQLLHAPTVKNFFCGFSTHEATQRAMAKVLTGQSTPGGQWPITLEPLLPDNEGWVVW